MPRKQGDSNYSVRELRMLAEQKELEAKLKALQAKVKVKEAVIRELRAKLGTSK